MGTFPTTTTTIAATRVGLADVVLAARGGDGRAWQELVRRYDAILWHVARAHRLDTATCADVVQQTWLTALQQIGALREPEAFGAWVRSIARRESLRVAARARRERPLPPQWEDGDAVEDERSGRRPEPPDDRMMRAQRHRLLEAAMETLPARQRDLLRLLTADPAPSYTEVSRRLGLPIGSIGPTRGRTLARLRAELLARGMDPEWACA